MSLRLTPGTLLWIGAIGLALLLGIYLIFSQDSGFLQFRQLREERDRLKNEVQQLQLEKEELQQQLEKLQKADPFVIEEEARRKGMIREGEEVYRLHYKVTPDSTTEGDEKKPQGR
ncbi:MAG: septum formation initiator family protein [bacterium]